MPGKHDWNSRESYFDIHYRVLRFFEPFMNPPVQYKHQIVTSNFEVLTARFVFTTSRGSVIKVSIKKDITIQHPKAGRTRAKTHAYRYHANLPDGRPLLRYCSPDDPNVIIDPKDHHTFHHKHVFDRLGNNIAVLDVTGTKDWPHVGDFLNELLTDF